MRYPPDERESVIISDVTTVTGMFRVAVMGGIGSGKTAVTDYLVARGAQLVDADVVAREVVRPGTPALQQLIDAFGRAILTPDGTLDRAFVASVVFCDTAALRRLNQITHTAIGVAMTNHLANFGDDDVVAIALPLYRPMHRELFQLNEVWCVQADPAVALERLITFRDFAEEDARARLAAQPSNDERQLLADVLIDNSGSVSDLRAKVDDLLRERNLLHA
jgi:dephospho-CoA kinase